MKVIASAAPKFQPVTVVITLETPDEVRAAKVLFYHTRTVPDAVQKEANLSPDERCAVRDLMSATHDAVKNV